MADEAVSYRTVAVGVDIVDSPLHTPDGGLLEAQNVQVIRKQGVGGIGSRPALKPFNTAALGGSVLAMTAVPLPSAVDSATLPTILIFTPTGLLRSTDGTTFSPLTLSVAPSRPPALWPFAIERAVVVTLADSTTRVVYAGTPSGGVTPIGVYNPGTDSATSPFSVTGDVTNLRSFGGKVYIGVATNGFEATSWDGLTPSTPLIAGEVVQYNPNTGSHVTMGQSFSQNDPTDIGAYTLGGLLAGFPQDQGLGLVPLGLTDDGTLLYAAVGAYAKQGKQPTKGGWTYNVLSLDPSAPAWALAGFAVLSEVIDANPPANFCFIGPPMSLSTAFTNVLVGSYSSWDRASVGNAADPALRDANSGNTFTDGGAVPAGGQGWFGPFHLFGSTLLVARAYLNSDGSAAAVTVYRLTTPGDVSTTVVDKDILGTFGGSVVPGQPYEFSGDLYWPMLGTVGNEAHGYLLKRTAAGAWSKVLSDVDYAGMAVSASLPA